MKFFPGGPKYFVSTGNDFPSLVITGHPPLDFDSSSSSPAPNNRATRSPTSPNVADITISLKSGRSALFASFASARDASASSDRSWNSSKITAEGRSIQSDVGVEFIGVSWS
eukprot:31327-Pelagococcus_subviridis.AAC.1